MIVMKLNQRKHKKKRPPQDYPATTAWLLTNPTGGRSIRIYEIHRRLQSQQDLEELTGGAWHRTLAPFPTPYRLDLAPHRLRELGLGLTEMGA